MTQAWQIRPFCVGNEAALRKVFHASVHGLAHPFYTPAQLQAWAPADYDIQAWSERMRTNRPWVAETADGAIAGFADLQPDGTIDMFFVAPAFARQGVARALMDRLHAQASQQGLLHLKAYVSLAAEPFFTAQGFVVEARQAVERAGIVLHNARMGKSLS